MSAPFNEFGPFAVGEVCIITGARNLKYLIGQEVTITGPKDWTTNSIDGARYEAYPVDREYKGLGVAVPEHFLRRRKPPASDSGERAFMEQIHKLAAPQKVGEPA